MFDPENCWASRVRGWPAKVTPETRPGSPVESVAPRSMPTTSSRLSPDPGLWLKLKVRLYVLPPTELLLPVVVANTEIVPWPPLRRVAAGGPNTGNAAPPPCTVALTPGAVDSAPAGTFT